MHTITHRNGIAFANISINCEYL